MCEWGLAHRELRGVESIGVDEIHWGRGLKADNFLTVIYQIDRQCRRLLWVGRRRSQATLRRGLKALGPEVVKGLRFVCSDMWKPYLQVIAAQAGQALHVLDRFHITSHLNQAVDQVRRAESSRLRGQKQESRPATQAYALALATPRQPGTRAGTAKAQCPARQQTGHRTGLGFEGDLLPFLEVQIRDLGRRLSRLLVLPGHAEPSGTDEKVARMLRAHEPLILNWFRAKEEISNGAVEGLNNKIRVVTRRSYGFRTYNAMEIALYHNLGRLPEPESPHRFC